MHLKLRNIIILNFVGIFEIANQIDTLKYDRYKEVSKKMKTTFNVLAQSTQDKLLEIAIVAANNKDIIEALNKNDVSFLNFNKVSKNLSNNTKLKDIWFHLITKKGDSLYRSWASSKSTAKLDTRPKVQELIKNPVINKELSVGQYDLSYKVMVPVYNKNEFIGILEVVSKLNIISDEIKKFEHNIAVLVDEQYKDYLIFPFSDKFIDDFYVANINVDNKLLNFIEKKGLFELVDSEEDFLLFEEDDLLVTTLVINNTNDVEMVYIVLTHKLSSIDISDIELIRDYLIIMFVFIIIVFISIVYYFYSKNYKVFMENINKELKNNKKEIETLYQHTRSSINYASVIQNSFLKSNKEFNIYFEDSFIIWNPKDIVGGDIYIFEEINSDECMLMIIDCTGHGVAGAFVTMIVKAIQRQIMIEITNSNEEINTAKILNKFNYEFNVIFKKDKNTNNSDFGFDGSVLYYNKKEMKIKYSGAKTPLYYFDKNNELNIFSSDKISIGYNNINLDYKFTEYLIDVYKDMTLYIVTDGYLDQGGGEKGYSFGKSRFKNMLKKNRQFNLATQKDIYMNNLNDYQNDEDRYDDITFIGLKI